MSSAEFRALIKEILERAIPLVETRVSALSRWTSSERVRVAHWFGRNDETTRTKLLNGLTKVASVLHSLTPANFVRTGSDRDRATDACRILPDRAKRRHTSVRLIPRRIRLALAQRFVQCVNGPLTAIREYQR